MPNPKYILAIDPGNVKSAFCLVKTETLKPLCFAKVDNVDESGKDVLLLAIASAFASVGCENASTQIVIENMMNFGMPVGRSVLDTCIWIGELRRWFVTAGYPVAYVFRNEEKMAICHNPKANDATIRQALIDRFAPNTPNHGKGSKKDKGFFYGMSADCWSAFAQAVTYHDMYLNLHVDELPF